MDKIKCYCGHTTYCDCGPLEENTFEMRNQKSKEQLIETVIKQIEVDVHCGDLQAIEELLGFVPVENLIAYLPEEDWKPFNHLVAEEHLKKEQDGRTS